MNAATSRSLRLAAVFTIIATVAQAQSPTKLTDISYPIPFGKEQSVCRVGDAYFFSVYDGQHSALWKTDGTIEGTTEVISGVGCTNLTEVGGFLCFAGSDSAYGQELWQSDGTSSGTFMVADICTGTLGSSPENLRDVDGTLVFVANDRLGGETDREIWAYTPTPAPPPPPPPDPGDVNRDDKTDVADVIALVDIITSRTATLAPIPLRVPR